MMWKLATRARVGGRDEAAEAEAEAPAGRWRLPEVGEYVLTGGEFGRGSNGTVLRGRHAVLGHEVAIKLLELKKVARTRPRPIAHAHAQAHAHEHTLARTHS